MDPANQPVTVVVTREVRVGREAAFEQAVHEWIPKAQKFLGYLGAFILRPPPGGHQYGAVIKFHSVDAWNTFRGSTEYSGFLEGLQEYLEGPPRVETATGFEAWFAPSGASLMRVPPRWKMALMTWLGVNLTALVLTYTLVPLTSGWPWIAGFVTFNAGVVAGLTWLTMPILGWLCGVWLKAISPSVSDQTDARNFS